MISIAQLLNKHPFEPQEVYHTILNEARNLCQAKHGNILLVYPDKLKILTSTYDKNVGDEVSLATSFCGNFIVLQDSESHVANDLHLPEYRGKNNPVFDEVDPDEPMRSEMAVGVYSLSDNEKYLLAIINLESPQPHAFNKSHVEQVKKLAEDAAIALMRAADREFEIEVSDLLSELANGDTPPESLQEDLLERLLHLLRATAGQIMEVEGDKLTILAHLGPHMLETGTTLDIDNSVVGVAVKERDPIRLNDVGVDEKFHKLYQGFRHPDGTPVMNSELVIPLLYNMNVIGVINIQSERRKAFSPRHEEMLVRLAPIIVLTQRNFDRRRNERDVFHATKGRLNLMREHAQDINDAIQAGKIPDANDASAISKYIGQLITVVERLVQNPNLGPFDLIPFVKEYLSEYDWQDIQQSLRVTFGSERPIVVADELRVKTTLRLLLENCFNTLERKDTNIKLQNPDVDFVKQINIILRPATDSRHAGYQIVIEDNGEGIRAANRTLIFSGHISRQNIRGTGLGLPDARRMMNSMLGEIRLLSTEINRGTTMGLTFRTVEVTTIFSLRAEALNPNMKVKIHIFTQDDSIVSWTRDIGRRPGNRFVAAHKEYVIDDALLEQIAREPTLLIIDHTCDAPKSITLFNRIRHFGEALPSGADADAIAQLDRPEYDVHLFWDKPVTANRMEQLIKDAREEPRRGYVWGRKAT
jgi:GAF domain-containing protein